MLTDTLKVLPEVVHKPQVIQLLQCGTLEDVQKTHPKHTSQQNPGKSPSATLADWAQNAAVKEYHYGS
jgi:hypothetical protein